ncbi:MAG: OmpA family protein [Salinivirgaceae bacterium]|nr:OmpA family protein [Salinivirgaceae bacterium]
MKTVLAFGIVLLMIPLTSFSQKNLVKNPGFEEYTDCPVRHTPENTTNTLIPHWTFPNKTASDYFNKCSDKGAGIPSNFAGYAQAKEGEAYAGGILSGSTFTHREYIQGELTEPMKKGKRYCVSFYYQLASGSRFAIDQLGLYLSNDKLAHNTKEEVKVEPQLKNPKGLFLTNTSEWEHFCRVYEATGGEKFLTIGNFRSYNETNYVGVEKKNKSSHTMTDYAYYYFDLVEIRELTKCEACACIPHDLEVAVVDSFYTGGFNPITGKIDRKQNDGRIRLALQGGTKPYNIIWNNGNKNAKLENLKAGVYSYTVTDALNCTRKGEIVFETPEIEENKVEDDLFSIKEGSAIVLNNIFFQTGKTTLLPQSYSELDKVAAFITDNSIKQIEISGHTDNVGNPDYNQRLSEGRAKAVVDYLVSKGVSQNVLTYKGYGQDRPVDTNETDEGKAQNRRVEFLLIKK